MLGHPAHNGAVWGEGLAEDFVFQTEKSLMAARLEKNFLYLTLVRRRYKSRSLRKQGSLRKLTSKNESLRKMSKRFPSDALFKVIDIDSTLLKVTYFRTDQIRSSLF